MYDSFAEVYDDLMDDVDYDSWAGFYQQHLGLPVHARMVECACGTGNLTLRFARMGYRVCGVDLSAQMLRQAEAKMRASGVEVPLIHQNMCHLELPRRVDAVLCTCDGINYLTAPAQLEQFFTRARQYLRSGGCLGFDFSTREKLEEQIGDTFLGEEREKVAYLWQNRLNREQHLLHMDITFFVQETDGRFRRFREEQTMRAWSLTEITDALTVSGFTDIRAYGEFREDAPRRGDTRIHIFAAPAGA